MAVAQTYIKIRESYLYSFELRLLMPRLTLGYFEWIVRRLRPSPGLALILLEIPGSSPAEAGASVGAEESTQL